MKRFFIVANVIGLIAFALFAWLQRNDVNPDMYVSASLYETWGWVALYALTAISFGLALGKRFIWTVLIAGILFCLVQMVLTGPGVLDNLRQGGFTVTKESMSPKRPHVELTREFFGALIALVSLGFLLWQAWWWKRWKTRQSLIADSTS